MIASLETFTKEAILPAYTYVVDGEDVFLVPLKRFNNTIFKQFGKSVVVDELKKRNLLLLGSRGTPAKQLMIPKSKPNTRCSFYVIRRSILSSQ